MEFSIPCLVDETPPPNSTYSVEFIYDFYGKFQVAKYANQQKLNSKEEEGDIM